MRPIALALLAALIATAPTRADPLNDAVSAARASFEAARPGLGPTLFDVDVAAYADALRLGPFVSSYWGAPTQVDLVLQDSADGACGNFAAFVRIPPRDGAVALTICPEFFTPGAETLRRLTILHEMVHVVAGPDECRAMAFAAQIEQLAFGSFTPVERYWQANSCDGSAFSLP